MINDKAGQIVDTEVFTGVGFWILFGLAAGATILGYLLSKSWGMISIPVWQLLVILVAEFAGAYFFASR